ncbi:uncharacterized protein [Chanodichthys erythropterus]|uniref:uncharacterized protein n=1 Tax=Chanodichthys erythropterus TaxID=933992 RepID=UPI00351E11F7
MGRSRKAKKTRTSDSPISTDSSSSPISTPIKTNCCSDVLLSINERHKEFQNLRHSLEYSQQVDSLTEENKSLKSSVDTLTAKLSTVATQLTSVTAENKAMQETILDLQSRSMRDNLIISGIPESSTDDPEKSVKDMVNQLKLTPETVEQITFHRVHRLGQKPLNSNRPRPIIVKFEHFKQKVLVQRQGRQLKGTHYGLNDQFPQEIIRRHREAVETLLPGIHRSTARYSVPHITLAPGTGKRPRHPASESRVRCSFSDGAHQTHGQSCPTIIMCSKCNMYSLALSVSSETYTCDKCRDIVRLTERISELETRIQTLIEDSENERALDTALDATSLVNTTHSVPVVEATQQANWVTVRRHNGKNKHHSSVPIRTSNRFSPLSDAPTENPVESALVIGDSITRNVKIETPATIVTCLPGARAPDIKANLKVLANAKRKYSKIIIHVGTNDVRLRQSEITKINIKEVCELANSMSAKVICSGPLPVRRSDEIVSRLSSLNGWLSKWCAQNNIGFIDNWKSFWGRPDLLKRDGIHPSRDGAALLSRNLANSLRAET